jgi:hypothetical protein
MMTIRSTWLTVVASALLVSPVAAQGGAERPAADTLGRRRIQPLPALGSAPETGLQFGATVLAVWEQPASRHARPASLTAAVIRTAKSQTRVGIVAEHWSAGNARRVGGSLQWQQFPLPYYGIGDNTPKSSEETFTPRGVEGTLTVQQRVARSWYATGGLRHLNQRIGTDSTGVLRSRTILGSTGGDITELSAGFQTDTRDNLFAPHHGRWVTLSYARSAKGALSDYTYGTARLDARMYTSLAAGHVLATQVQIVSVDGGAPFDQLALVGNSDILRGYARGRYRDRATAAAQAEYRTPTRRRLGAVAFGGLGVAAPRLSAVTDARLLPTYGVGLRAQIDARQRTGVRMDYGRGRDGASGLYIGFNQAF